MNAFFAVQSGEETLNFFNFSASGLYANKDNQYLAMPFSKEKNEVIVVRFRAPGYAGESGVEAKVRYWSISLGNDETKTVQTLADYELEANEDSFYYIVLDNSNSSIETTHSNLSSPDGMIRGLIVYRNMLTDEEYEFNFNLIPGFDYEKDIETQKASDYLGDFAPIGVRVSAERFAKIKRLETLFP